MQLIVNYGSVSLYTVLVEWWNGTVNYSTMLDFCPRGFLPRARSLATRRSSVPSRPNDQQKITPN